MAAKMATIFGDATGLQQYGPPFVKNSEIRNGSEFRNGFQFWNSSEIRNGFESLGMVPKIS